jgi:hypothetical protein
VQWIFDETEREAQARRDRLRRLDKMIFIERLVGQLAVVVLCSSALWFAYQLGLAGHETAAIAIGTTAVIGLAGAVLSNLRKS